MAQEPLFDYRASRQRRRRALSGSREGADFLMNRAVADLGERLAVVERTFENCASLFSMTGGAVAAMTESGKCGRIIRFEEECYADDAAGPVTVASPDALPLADGGLNLAVSLLSMHRFNDLPGFLTQVRRALAPDGLFLAALPAAGTLAELRECLLAAEAETSGGASARVMPFADVRQLGALLQRAGFALPVTDVDSVVVRYDTLFDLIRDLRATASTNTLKDREIRPPNRQMFLRAAEIYAQRFADPDGRIRATFQIAWMSGWCPHESQQKPARRGSATTRLADFLK